MFFVVGIWSWYSKTQVILPSPSPTPQSQNSPQAVVDIQLKTSQTDASNYALDSDLSVIDIQLNNLNADFLSISQPENLPEIQTSSESTATIIGRADQQIDQWTKNLRTLLSRAGSMKNISSPDISNLDGLLQNEITSLINLKNKIDADTNLASAIADYRAIYNSYPGYSSTFSIGMIISASDRALEVANSMAFVFRKVLTRIPSNNSFDGFKTKIINAHEQAKDSASKALTSATLAPVKITLSNAVNNLTSARTDLGQIVRSVKETTADPTNGK